MLWLTSFVKQKVDNVLPASMGSGLTMLIDKRRAEIHLAVTVFVAHTTIQGLAKRKPVLSVTC